MFETALHCGISSLEDVPIIRSNRCLNYSYNVLIYSQLRPRNCDCTISRIEGETVTHHSGIVHDGNIHDGNIHDGNIHDESNFTPRYFVHSRGKGRLLFKNRYLH